VLPGLGDATGVDEDDSVGDRADLADCVVNVDGVVVVVGVGVDEVTVLVVVRGVVEAVSEGSGVVEVVEAVVAEWSSSSSSSVVYTE